MYKIFANTAFIGKKYIYLPTCRSTNDISAEYIQQGRAVHGQVVATSHQTAGRGQRGNSWETAPDTNLTFSIILQPHFLLPSDQFWLNIAISLGIVDALAPLVNAPLRIKWPNDLLIGGKKVGGILIENFLKQHLIEHSIVGIGLNINQLEFNSPTAVSLAMATGKTFDLARVLETVLEAIEVRYLAIEMGEREKLKAAYLGLLYGYHEVRHYEDLTLPDGPVAFEGQILGVDAHGKLAVGMGQKVKYFGFKEIKFLF